MKERDPGTDGLREEHGLPYDFRRQQRIVDGNEKVAIHGDAPLLLPTGCYTSDAANPLPIKKN
jgi:hypothetical protein